MSEAKKSEIDIILADPKFLQLSLDVMNMDQDINEEFLVPFSEEDEDDDGNLIVKTRKGDYGNVLKYVPAKYVRQRCDKAFNNKWSFYIIAQKRETEPFDRWSKKDEDYIDGDRYLLCIGLMIVPGLGVRMEYGVKKVFGGGESTDWKACKTDAFKKCCEAFGIYLDYEIEDDEADDNTSSSKSNNKNKGKAKSKVSVDNVEYDDDELEEALETQLGFGKYKGSTLSEIAEDDMSYIEWLVENANEEEMQETAAIVMKHYKDQEEEKSSRRSKGTTKSKNSSKNSKSSNRKSSSRDEEDEDDEEEEEESKPSKSKKSGKKESGNKNKEFNRLLEACAEELEAYDKVQMKAIMSSVSVSNKYPKGKSKLEDFTLNELKELAEVLYIEEE